MAQFRGTVQGNKGKASRLGSKGSGLVVEANGWGNGVRVESWYDPESDRDLHEIYLTTGSSPEGKERSIGIVAEGEEGPEWIPGI